MKKGYLISVPKQTNLAAKSSVSGASPLSRNESSNCGKTGPLLNWFSYVLTINSVARYHRSD
jgi:hypothetical protein